MLGGDPVSESLFCVERDTAYEQFVGGNLKGDGTICAIRGLFALLTHPLAFWQSLILQAFREECNFRGLCGAVADKPTVHSANNDNVVGVAGEDELAVAGDLADIVGDEVTVLHPRPDSIAMNRLDGKFAMVGLDGHRYAKLLHVAGTADCVCLLASLA